MEAISIYKMDLLLQPGLRTKEMSMAAHVLIFQLKNCGQQLLLLVAMLQITLLALRMLLLVLIPDKTIIFI
jgi:hypothetical protein